jgi:hypothetical protein
MVYLLEISAIGGLLLCVAGFAAWLRRKPTLPFEDRIKVWDIFAKLVGTLTIVVAAGFPLFQYLEQQATTFAQQQYDYKIRELDNARDRFGAIIANAHTIIALLATHVGSGGQESSREFDNIGQISVTLHGVIGFPEARVKSGGQEATRDNSVEGAYSGPEERAASQSSGPLVLSSYDQAVLQFDITRDQKMLGVAGPQVQEAMRRFREQLPSTYPAKCGSAAGELGKLRDLLAHLRSACIDELKDKKEHLFPTTSR